MFAKARAGHVTGGRTYGYNNLRVNGHVEHRVNTAEAAVVLRIFTAYAAGQGLKAIAAGLNADRVPALRSASGWAPGSVRAILLRETYCGVKVYGKSKKRDADGARNQRPVSEARWLHTEMSELRIIPAEIEAQVAARRREIDGRYIGGRKGGRPPGQNVKYLLVGLLTCGVCGGTMEVVTSKTSGGRRLVSYQCCTSRRKGVTVCANRQPAPIAAAHEAVIEKVGKIIDPRVAERALTYALNVISEDGSEERRAQMTNRLDALGRECRNLSTAIARGGDLDALLVELQAREQERVSLRKRLSVLEADARTTSRAALRTQLSAYLADMKALLTGPDVSQAQGVLKKLIAGRLTFNPQADGTYAFKGTGTVEPVLAGLVPRYTECGVPNGIRTRVLALKGPRPGPLDDGDVRRRARIYRS